MMSQIFHFRSYFSFCVKNRVPLGDFFELKFLHFIKTRFPATVSHEYMYVENLNGCYGILREKSMFKKCL